MHLSPSSICPFKERWEFEFRTILEGDMCSRRQDQWHTKSTAHNQAQQRSHSTQSHKHHMMHTALHVFCFLSSLFTPFFHPSFLVSFFFLCTFFPSFPVFIFSLAFFLSASSSFRPLLFAGIDFVGIYFQCEGFYV